MFKVNAGFPKLLKGNALYKNPISHVVYKFLKWTSALVVFAVLQILIFKIPAAGTGFKNTGLLPATAKFAVKYWTGRWNTGHLATLWTGHRDSPRQTGTYGG